MTFVAAPALKGSGHALDGDDFLLSHVVPAIVSALRLHGATTGSSVSLNIVISATSALTSLADEQWALDGFDHNAVTDAAARSGAAELSRRRCGRISQSSTGWT